MGNFLDKPETQGWALKQISKAISDHNNYLLSLDIPKNIVEKIPPEEDVEKRNNFLEDLNLDFLTEDQKQKVINYRNIIKQKYDEARRLFEGKFI